MAKRKPRRRGRRFHWIAADHVARLLYLLDEGRLKDHDLYWRLYQQELRALTNGREPWPPDHPVFADLFGGFADQPSTKG